MGMRIIRPRCPNSKPSFILIDLEFFKKMNTYLCDHDMKVKVIQIGFAISCSWGTDYTFSLYTDLKNGTNTREHPQRYISAQTDKHTEGASIIKNRLFCDHLCQSGRANTQMIHIHHTYKSLFQPSPLHNCCKSFGHFMPLWLNYGHSKWHLNDQCNGNYKHSMFERNHFISNWVKKTFPFFLFLFVCYCFSFSHKISHLRLSLSNNRRGASHLACAGILAPCTLTLEWFWELRYFDLLTLWSWQRSMVPTRVAGLKEFGKKVCILYTTLQAPTQRWTDEHDWFRRTIWYSYGSKSKLCKDNTSPLPSPMLHNYLKIYP